MSKTDGRKTPGFFCWNLDFVIGGMISALILALGITITFYTYESQKKTALKNTEKIFEQSSIQIEGKLSGLLRSIENFVTVTAVLERLGNTANRNIDILLPYFKQSFVSLPWLEAFYVGYEDGSFYMIQDLRENKPIRDAVKAPEAASFSVKKIPPESLLDHKTRYLFYGENLHLIETRDVEPDGFDPRKRAWYSSAIKTDTTIFTEPYLFFSTGQIGVTTACALVGRTGVVGADSVLLSIAHNIEEQKLTTSTKIALLDKKGLMFFSASEADVLLLQESHMRPGSQRLHVKDLGSQVLNVIYQESVKKGVSGGMLVEINGAYWFANIRKLINGNEKGMFLIIGAPIKELLHDALLTRRRTLYTLALSMAVALLVGLYFSRQVAVSLYELSKQAESVREFKLSSVFNVRSRITEVSELAESMTVMQSAINRFVAIARALSAERNMGRVLEMIVKEAQSVTGADGGGIGLVSDDGKTFKYLMVRNTVSGVAFDETDTPMAAKTIDLSQGRENYIEVAVIEDAKTLVYDDIHKTNSKGELFSQVVSLHGSEDYRCSSLLFIPLLNRREEVIGLLHLVNARNKQEGEICSFSEDKVSYVSALASNAALALDNNRLIRAQKELFDSFVRLIAGAIDTKSPYTGGHCQRVPVLAEMLSEAASSSTSSIFKEFELNQDERYELFVASWLHDCGKMTTPEYVVDKATKLESNYNRIHEIRTRFEVLWRDLDVCYYRGLAGDSSQEKVLAKVRDGGRKTLRDDFSFVAKCNVGGEYMALENIERLRHIARKTWFRNFDNRLGLSGGEEARMDMDAFVEFPVQESLLADKKEHIIERGDGGLPYGDNLRGITMVVPEHRSNLGELYNLSIEKGTLTEEERFTINNHIVQTIEMLSKLPFPKEIQRVPDWAGNHHEKLDGSGYPRGLIATQLSIPERIMAIADIFEALTAADRPYKTPKKLSTCLQIMSSMRNEGHICPDLFELFLRSGLHASYAEKYMKREQIDDVNIEEYL